MRPRRTLARLALAIAAGLISTPWPASSVAAQEIDFEGSVTFSVSGGASGSFTWEGHGAFERETPDEVSLTFRGADGESLLFNKFVDLPWAVELWVDDASGTLQNWNNFGDENLNKCTVTLSQSEASLSGTFTCTQLSRPFAEVPPVDLSGSFNLSAVGTPPPTATPTSTPAGSRCQVVEGRATDRRARPISNAHVRLESAGTVLDEAGSGTDGGYRLAVPEGTGAIRVVLLAEEWGHSPSRFRLVFGSDVVGVATSEFDPANGVCTWDFEMGVLAPGSVLIPSSTVDVEAAFDIYQSLDVSWALATRMQPEPARGLPLPVFVSCERSTPPAGVICPNPGIHFHSTSSGMPYIAIDAAASSYQPADIPNMIGHEFGHFFMWSAFGAIPHDPRNTAHAGYYVNPSSADAWIEGFASFISLMARREVSGDAGATVVGSAGDMELDRKVWELAGRFEEFAVVGILLDLVDGPDLQTGQGPAARPVPDASIHVSSARDLFVAEVPAGTANGSPWRAELLDNAGRRLRTVNGAVVEWEGRRVTAGLLPDIPFARIRVTVGLTGQPADDDPVDGDLFSLWNAILAFRSSNPAAAGASFHLFDVAELYQMAQGLFGSVDANANGTSDVEEIFVAHGYFADTAGGVSNQIRDVDETAGLSSHTTRQVDGTTFGAMDPRSSPPVLPELQARIDTGGVPATALVQVGFAEPNEGRSFAMLVEPDADGLVALPVPPPGSGGTVSVIMLAAGYRPAPALEIDAEGFWPQAERNVGASFLSAAVRMERGGFLPASPLTTGWSSGGPPFVLVTLLAAAVAGILAYLIANRRLRPSGGAGR